MTNANNTEKPVWDFWEKHFKEDDSVYFSDWEGMFDYYYAFDDKKTIDSELIYGNHMPESNIEFSVMIPAYKRVDSLKKAIDSAINQSYKLPYEIVIVDDSGDKITEIDNFMKEYCEKYNNIIYYRNSTNLGANDNWNRLAILCRTPWFCMLHDDDELLPNYLEFFANKLPIFNKKNVSIVTPGVLDTTAAFRKTRFLLHITVGKIRTYTVLKLKDAVSGCLPGTVATLYNKEKFISLGGLNFKWGVLADSVFFSQSQEKYSNVIYKEYLCFAGRGGDSASTNPVVLTYGMLSNFQRTKAIAKHLGYSDKKALKLATQQSIFYENAVLGLGGDVISFDNARKKLGISKKYKNKLLKRFIYYKFLFKIYTIYYC